VSGHSGIQPGPYSGREAFEVVELPPGVWPRQRNPEGRESAKFFSLKRPAELPPTVFIYRKQLRGRGSCSTSTLNKRGSMSNFTVKKKGPKHLRRLRVAKIFISAYVRLSEDDKVKVERFLALSAYDDAGMEHYVPHSTRHRVKSEHSLSDFVSMPVRDAWSQWAKMVKRANLMDSNGLKPSARCWACSSHKRIGPRSRNLNCAKLRKRHSSGPGGTHSMMLRRVSRLPPNTSAVLRQLHPGSILRKQPSSFVLWRAAFHFKGDQAVHPNASHRLK